MPGPTTPPQRVLDLPCGLAFHGARLPVGIGADVVRAGPEPTSIPRPASTGTPASGGCGWLAVLLDDAQRRGHGAMTVGVRDADTVRDRAAG